MTIQKALPDIQERAQRFVDCSRPIVRVHCAGSGACSTPTGASALLLAALHSAFPTVVVHDVGWGRVRCTLPVRGSAVGQGIVPLAHVFRVLEALKGNTMLGISGFSVQQPTLEDVFLAVCGRQLDEGGQALVSKPTPQSSVPVNHNPVLQCAYPAS